MAMAQAMTWGLGERRQSAAIERRETNWGVVITEKVPDSRLVELAETVIRSFGLLIILGGGALTLFVSVSNQNNSMLFSLGMAMAFILVGFSTYRYANNGFRAELRIDSRFGEVRLGSVNSSGDFTAKRVSRKSDIESFFVMRSKQGKAKLCMRMRNNSQRVDLFEGPEKELVPALERIVEALFAQKGKAGRVRTKVTNRFIHASFG